MIHPLVISSFTDKCSNQNRGLRYQTTGSEDFQTPLRPLPRPQKAPAQHYKPWLGCSAQGHFHPILLPWRAKTRRSQRTRVRTFWKYKACPNSNGDIPTCIMHVKYKHTHVCENFFYGRNENLSRTVKNSLERKKRDHEYSYGFVSKGILQTLRGMLSGTQSESFGRVRREKVLHVGSSSFQIEREPGLGVWRECGISVSDRPLHLT